jgi:cytochrome c biogenesis factor
MFSLFGNISSLNLMAAFNAGLFNGLLLVHPLLLFLSYIFIFLVSFEYFSKFSESKHFSSLNAFLMRYALFFIIVSIILGALWAQQELN